MKKLSAIILTFLCLFIFTSCGKTPDYTQRISQLRENIFFCQADNYMLLCYPEIREKPFENDGFIGKKENVVIFKLVFSADSPKSETPIITFSSGEKTYSKQFEFKSGSAAMTCTIAVETLPVEDFSARLKLFDKETDISLTSLKKNCVFNYKDIINLLKLSNNNTVVDFISNPDNYELKIRLLENSGYNFWYVGIIGKENPVALLYDAASGELIAVKKLGE